MLASMLNLDQLQSAVAAAKRCFTLLREKHPDLNGRVDPIQKKRLKPVARLVLSLPGGQTEIDSPPKQILAKFPAMIVDAAAKTTALRVLARVKGLEEEADADPEAARLKEQLEQLAAQFQYDENCQVELRFHELNYELIWRLQADDLVDRHLTPPTKASIRIVLGTLAKFEGTCQEKEADHDK